MLTNSTPLAVTRRPDAADPDRCDTFHDRARALAVRDALMTPDQIRLLAETFRVLGDATRVRILDALATGELCVCDLATLLGHTESAVSHQLRLLRGMRLVRSRRDGRMVFYTLDDQHIVQLFAQALEHVAESTHGRKPRSG